MRNLLKYQKTRGSLLDYLYHRKYYKLIGIDVSVNKYRKYNIQYTTGKEKQTYSLTNLFHRKFRKKQQCNKDFYR